MPRAAALLGLAFLLPLGPVAAPPGAVADPGVAPPVPPPADHHLHAWSADAVKAVARIQEAVGQQVVEPDKQIPLDGDDVVAALDSAGIRRGVLLSVAYFFGVPDVDFENERALVRAENDFVARQVRRHPDRLTGFASVNPLAAYALEEIERSAGIEGISGLKLHLANSDVNLRNDVHVDRLREVFEKAGALGLPVAIHLYTRHPDYGERDARIFLERVLPAAPSIPVQVAHLGGGGGYGEDTEGALRAFLAAFEEDPEATEHVFFDLSGTAHPEALARGDSALLERVRTINAAVARAVRELGPDRVVYGTDWPILGVAEYVAGLRGGLPLSDPELLDLLDDAAPYLH